MSVDTSITIGTGFVLDNDLVLAWGKGDDFSPEDYTVDEIADALFADQPLLTPVIAGSYYDATAPIQFIAAVSRLTEEHDVHDIPGGIVHEVVEMPILRHEELDALNALAEAIQQYDWVLLRNFASVLWS